LNSPSEVERICVGALEHPSSERAAFVLEACQGDAALQHEVESLLAHAARADRFLAQPALHADAALAGLSGLSIGQRLGAYQVIARLGAGGMGEVYRGRDTRLGRDVAIKVLPVVFAADPERLARFEREARLLASLNHPHIAAIYGIETGPEETGRQVRALVMELVEGIALSDRIARGRVPVAEAVVIAQQIADALAAAHEQGIIHRDLKPANIRLRADGTVKVLDFGLAKALPAWSALPDSAAASPTAHVSEAGLILGTAAYMSPEQARGQLVDTRSDVWAFGCVLFEMLAGRKAFAGETATDTLAAIIEREPAWTTLPASLPVSIQRLLHRCFEKDPKRRLRDIGDARPELEDSQGGAQPGLPIVPAPSRRRERLAWLSGLALVNMIAVATIAWALRSVPTLPETRFDISTPQTRNLSMAIAPDGQTLAFVAASESGPRLWLRSMASGSAQPVAGTEGAGGLFWSPDSRSVGFFAGDKLKRVDIGGGGVQVLANAQNAYRGTWSPDGTILFGLATSAPIFRVSETAGEPAPVTPAGQPGEHSSPEFLPDHRHFLYYVRNIAEPGVYVGQIDGGETRRLLAADSPAVYAPSGQLLFIRQDTLFAQNFDPERLQLAGSPYPVAHGALNGNVSVSATGAVAYRPGAFGGGLGSAPQQLIWFDRSGREIENAGDSVHSGRANPEMSPDGRHVALWRTVSGNPDVWSFDLRRRALSRLTTDASTDNNPIWSPDGFRIVFSSNRKGVLDLYEMSATRQGSEKLLLATGQDLNPSDFSRDGQFLLYSSVDPTTRSDARSDIWVLPMRGGGKPFPVVQTNANERYAQFSPDRKWIAYQSDESGRDEVYLQPFPGPGGRVTMSTNGGVQIRWRNDGKELFYVALDGRLMAVPIPLSAGGHTVEAGVPAALFLTRVFAIQGINIRQQYMPSANGQRFLVDSVPEDPAQPPITVILNWKPEP